MKMQKRRLMWHGMLLFLSDDRNYRYVDTRSLGSSRNGRRGQR
jgi:hypothetical protein